MDTFKILLVEDEPKLGLSIQKELNENGYQIDLAPDGAEGDRFFKKNAYDMVLLDVNLPYINGLDLCRIFRTSNPKIPILMLTALGELDDKLEAFSAGADDYVVKPFHFSELLARVKVFQKRQEVTNSARQDVLTFGDLRLDLYEKTVFRGKTPIVLTAREFSLLTLLMKANGKTVSKKEIAEKVWQMNFDTGTNTIEVYINFLRNKVDKNFGVKLIQTKPGFGYYLSEK